MQRKAIANMEEYQQNPASLLQLATTLNISIKFQSIHLRYTKPTRKTEGLV